MSLRKKKKSGKLTSRYNQETFKLIFEHSPIAIWQEDLSSIARLREYLRKDKVQNVRKFLGAHPYLTRKTAQGFRILNINRAALKIFDAKTKQELLTHRRKAVTPEMDKILLEGIVALLEGRKIFQSEVRDKTLRGKSFYAILRVAVPDKYTKSFSRAVVTLQDITAQKKLERHLEKVARLDSLTKLLNHKTILACLEDELLRVKRYGLNFSCMMIDLDNFKMVNDRFGHPKGDQVLRQSASIIKQCLRRVDIIGRYGGDEFLVILPQTKPKAARIAALRIQKIFMSRGFRLPGKQVLDNTLSIGIVGYPARDIKSVKMLVARADKAMYDAKKKGRNKIAIA